MNRQSYEEIVIVIVSKMIEIVQIGTLTTGSTAAVVTTTATTTAKIEHRSLQEAYWILILF